MDTPGTETAYAARTVRRIADIDAAAWNACANPQPSRLNPFVSHAFLKAMEDAGCVGGRSGWTPMHVVVERDGTPPGDILAAAPCYVKTHSQGEYVFDYPWADAYQRAGGNYYPKFQVSVPFSPVPGPRLLVKPGATSGEAEAVLGLSLSRLAEQSGVSSVHITFLEEAVANRLTEVGYLVRTGQQFHWANASYATFDDFLATLASRKRKAIRKERELAVMNGIEIEHITGSDITEAHWDAMYAFYLDTGERKWGRPYLNRRFFSLLGEAMADRCLLIFARREGRHIAGALNLIGGDCLYGRYWGAIEQHPALHFEVCYHQAIDYAIAHGLPRVEAGAQGEHKLARGYMPVTTWSAHWIADPAFRHAVARFLTSERAAIADAIEAYGELGPFRRGPASTIGSVAAPSSASADGGTIIAASAADPRSDDHD
ncbi:MAG: GNAT family N-acetyltransferase [Hyphomicrobiaceae bacterium]|nr:GNAT family N-acetyltransferase [Hyphomicrobiaceae bacterium]